MHFHSAVEAVPPMYRNEFILKADYRKLLRCTNVRLFIPVGSNFIDSCKKTDFLYPTVQLYVYR